MKRYNALIKIFICISFFIEVTLVGCYTLAGDGIHGGENQPITTEKLLYEVEYLGIAVGYLEMVINEPRFIEDKEVIIIEVRGRNYSPFYKIFPIDYNFMSYIDKERSLPLKYVVKCQEGRTKKHTLITFDHKNHVAQVNNILSDSKEIISIPMDVQDPISVFYNFRDLDVEDKDKIEYKVLGREGMYTIFAYIKNDGKLDIQGYDLSKAIYIESYAYLHKNGRHEKSKKTKGYIAKGLKVPIIAIADAPFFTRVYVKLKKTKRHI